MSTRILVACAMGVYLAAAGQATAQVTDAVKSDVRTAATSGNLESLGALLKTYPELLDGDVGAGRTPLYHAAAQGRAEVVAFLLSQGSKAQTWDEKKVPLLYSVCCYVSNPAKVAELLLDHGAWIDCPGPEGRSPLYAAAIHGETPLVKLLLERGANVNAKSTAGGRDRLIHAVLRRCASDEDKPDYRGVFEVMLQHEPDLSGCLEIAVAQGMTGMVERLLESGANVEEELAERSRLRSRGFHEPRQPTYLGNRPLHRAVALDRLEIVKLLLEHGASVNARNDFSRTPLHTAAEAGHTKAAELLIAAGADTRAVDIHGQMPVDLANRNNHHAVTALLAE